MCTFQVFEDMQNRGMRGDVCSYATLITCCERARDWRKAEEARACPRSFLFEGFKAFNKT